MAIVRVINDIAKVQKRLVLARAKDLWVQYISSINQYSSLKKPEPLEKKILLTGAKVRLM